MRNLKRNVALIGSTAVIAAAGLGGITTAQADNSTNPTQSSDRSQSSDKDEKDEKGEKGEVEEAEDGPNQGPDANKNEPGHQDADESGETE